MNLKWRETGCVSGYAFTTSHESTEVSRGRHCPWNQFVFWISYLTNYSMTLHLNCQTQNYFNLCSTLFIMGFFLMINEYLILTFLWLCLKQFLRYQLTWPLRRLVLVLLSLYWINSLWTLDRNPVAFVLYLFRLIKVSNFVLCFNYIYIVCFSFDIYPPTLRCQ